jgi:hypothetical protein
MAFYQLDPEVAPRDVRIDEATLQKLTDRLRTEIESGKLSGAHNFALYRHGKRVLDVGGVSPVRAIRSR